MLPLALLLLAAAPTERPIQLAVPAFSPVNVTPEVAAFYSEHFASNLAINGAGVITQKQMQTLLGLERQKQLLGCATDAESCLAELSNALGVDAVVQGEVGKFGSSFQLNVKIIDARTAKPLSILSERVSSEEKVLDLLADEAPRMVREVAVGLGRVAPDVVEPSKPLSKKVIAIAPAAVALAGLGGAVFFAVQSGSQFDRVRNSHAQTPLVTIKSDAQKAERSRNLSLLCGGVALAAGAAAVYLFTREAAPVVTPSVGVTGTAATFSISGSFR